jgi:hypothetical protein
VFVCCSMKAFIHKKNKNIYIYILWPRVVDDLVEDNNKL